eukprot:scaffold50972_cov72-Phaeocystis_antarctica.AAC.1
MKVPVKCMLLMCCQVLLSELLVLAVADGSVTLSQHTLTHRSGLGWVWIPTKPVHTHQRDCGLDSHSRHHPRRPAASSLGEMSKLTLFLPRETAVAQKRPYHASLEM